MTLKRFPVTVVKFLVSAGLCLVVGVAWHEIVGHCLVGVAMGDRIEWITILGLRVWPAIEWQGWPKVYGECNLAGALSGPSENIMLLGGSLSTWCVSCVAVVMLWLRRWPRRVRYVLAWLSIWWIDLLTYTLPSWGLRRSIFWGMIYSEPYEAATALGIPGAVFQAFAVGTGPLLAVALGVRLWLDRRARRRDFVRPTE